MDAVLGEPVRMIWTTDRRNEMNRWASYALMVMEMGRSRAPTSG